MASLVRLIAVLASAIIALSLLFFVVDQSSEGRETQLRDLQGQSGVTVRSQDDVDAPAPEAAEERVRERQHSSVREAIDDGNDVLAAPFTSVTGSSDLWLQRLVSAGLGLLLFGLGGLLLANWLPDRRAGHSDWREAAG